MDSIQRAKLLFNGTAAGKREQTERARTPTTYIIPGTATTDSENGVVKVDLGGYTVTPPDLQNGDSGVDIESDLEQAVEVDTVAHVQEGDTVQVMVTGVPGAAKNLAVVGVVAGGDRTNEIVISAKTAAENASTLAGEVNGLASEAKQLAQEANALANQQNDKINTAVAKADEAATKVTGLESIIGDTSEWQDTDSVASMLKTQRTSIQQNANAISQTASSVTTVQNDVSTIRAKADAAQTKANEASSAVAAAQSELTQAQADLQALSTTTSANTADIADAKARVAQAETNVANAVNEAAQAKAAANAASELANSFGQRITTAETNISQNSMAIALKASKEEVTAGINTAKEYTDSRIQITSDAITQKVTKVEDTLAVNSVGRNLFLNSANVSYDYDPNNSASVPIAISEYGKHAAKPREHVFGSVDLFISNDPDFVDIFIIRVYGLNGLGEEVRMLDLELINIERNQWRRKVCERIIPEDFKSFTRAEMLMPSVTPSNIAHALKMKNPKFEIGTSATDWSVAPEDYGSQITSLDGNLAALSGRVTTAESNITQNSGRITSEVSRIDGELNTMSTTVSQTAEGITTVISKVDNLDVGGNNLLRNSDTLDYSIYTFNGDTITTTQPLSTVTGQDISSTQIATIHGKQPAHTLTLTNVIDSFYIDDGTDIHRATTDVVKNLVTQDVAPRVSILQSNVSTLQGTANAQASLIQSLQSRIETLEASGGGGGSVNPLDLFKVGYVWISFTSTSPASLFGGTWEKIDKGRFLIATDGSVSAGTFIGAEKHSHQYGVAYATYYGAVVGNDENNIMTMALDNGAPANLNNATPAFANFGGMATKKNSALSSATTNVTPHYRYSESPTSDSPNTPPAIYVYMWRRIE